MRALGGPAGIQNLVSETSMNTIKAAGTVWAVFGHRFAIDGAEGRYLADLGPKGIEGVPLGVGDSVSVEGERKPTEIKVFSLTLADGRTLAIAWPEAPADADPATAIAAAEAAGYAVTGEPKRKPRHFDVPAAKDGRACTLHVAFDGTIRPEKVAQAEAA